MVLIRKTLNQTIDLMSNNKLDYDPCAGAKLSLNLVISIVSAIPPQNYPLVPIKMSHKKKKEHHMIRSHNKKTVNPFRDDDRLVIM